MGAQHRLIKPATGEAYDLGKPAKRPPVDDWETIVQDVSSFEDAWHDAMHPSERAMWKIGSDHRNCTVRTLSERFGREELADLIQTACLREDDRTHALRIADDVLLWADDEPTVLVPDDISVTDLSGRMGTDIAEPRVVRSIRDVARKEGGNHD